MNLAGAQPTTITGNLTTNSYNGTITQGVSAVSVSGTAALNAGTGAITLANAANNFATVQATSSGTVTLTDANGTERTLKVGRTLPGATTQQAAVESSDRAGKPVIVAKRDIADIFKPLSALRDRALVDVAGQIRCECRESWRHELSVPAPPLETRIEGYLDLLSQAVW